MRSARLISASILNECNIISVSRCLRSKNRKTGHSTCRTYFPIRWALDRAEINVGFGTLVPLPFAPHLMLKGLNGNPDIDHYIFAYSRLPFHSNDTNKAADEFFCPADGRAMRLPGGATRFPKTFPGAGSRMDAKAGIRVDIDILYFDFFWTWRDK